MWKGLSASPVALSFGATYQSLQTKLIDGQENSLAVISGAKFYEVQKYCSITNHGWEGVWTVVNPDKWGKMPKSLQDIVHRNVMGMVEPQRKAMAQLNSTIESDLKSKGLEFNVASSETFRTALAKSGYYAEWRAKFGPQAWRALEKYSGPLG
jgi:TRAP-type C4-dicarboxylate transport system substrate-binding protein